MAKIKFAKKIRTLYKIARCYLFGKSVPLSVGIRLTDRCNSKCRYCGIKYGGKELTTKEIFYIIDKVAKDCIHIDLLGGEPLLRKDIDEIIDYASKKDILLQVTTNGSLVENHLDALRKVDMLVVSLDGDERTNDKIRGKGGYRKAIRALKLARAEGIPLFTNTVLTKYNIDQGNFIIKKAEELGFKASFEMVTDFALSGGDVGDLFPPKEALVNFVRNLKSEKKKGNKHVGISMRFLDYLGNWPNLPHLKCYAGLFYCHIDSQGNVYSCNLLKSPRGPRNIFKDSLDNILKDLKNIKCKGCWCLPNVDYNLVFSFKRSPNLLRIFGGKK